MAGDLHAPILPSLDNFRDVGGAPTADGHRVRRGLLYRSDTLTKLNAVDSEGFARLGIRTVIDLRRPHEVEEFGRIADAVDRRYVNISPEHAEWHGTTYDEIAGPARFLADRYHDLARDGATGIGEVVLTLAEVSAKPTVVHCLAGKDRTGVVVALTLAAIGVRVDAIADDYALSNEWAKKFTPDGVEPHWVPAPREAMTLFLAELAGRHGSIAGYLAHTGVGAAEVKTLRDNLVG